MAAISALCQGQRPAGTAGLRWAVWLGMAVCLVGPLPARGSDLLEGESVEHLYLDEVIAGAGGKSDVLLVARPLNSAGDPVKGLRAVDFEVVQDGTRIDKRSVSVSTVGSENEGLTLVLSIDHSPTMRGSALEQAKALALDLVGELRPQDKVAVVALAGQPQVVAPFSAAREDTLARIKAIEVEPAELATPVFDGIYKAVSLIREGEAQLPKRSFIVAFTDGSDSASQHTPEDIIALARGDAKRAQLPVFTVGFSRFGGSGLPALKNLSEKTRAAFHEVSSEKAHVTLDGVWKQMSEPYLLRYSARMDGGTHNLQIGVEEATDTRRVPFPAIGLPWLPIAGGVVGFVAVAAVGTLALRKRSRGSLVFVSGSRAGERISLKPGCNRIGSLGENDIILDSEVVSRHHAEIRIAGKRVEIEDLHSLNGTMLNGEALHSVSLLSPGDRIRIADVDLRYEK